MKILDIIIDFKVYSWADLYIISSKQGHYLWKDGTIHKRMSESDGKKYENLLDNPKWGYWESEDEAKKFLKEWNSHNQLHRVESIENIG